MPPLWVCSDCHLLLGLDLLHNETKKLVCVNCSAIHHLNSIPFMQQSPINELQRIIEERIPNHFLDHLRYRWLSSATVGLQFDVDKVEFFEEVGHDFYDFIEDEVSDSLNLFITVEFE